MHLPHRPPLPYSRKLSSFIVIGVFRLFLFLSLLTAIGCLLSAFAFQPVQRRPFVIIDQAQQLTFLQQPSSSRMLQPQILRNIRSKRYTQSPYLRRFYSDSNSNSNNNIFMNSNMSMDKKRKSSPLSIAAASSVAKTTNDSLPSSTTTAKLLMILSPAKTLCLDIEKETNHNSQLMAWTKPLNELATKRSKVIAAMKWHSLNKEKLGKLLKTSKKITETACDYWKNIPDDAVTMSSGCGSLSQQSGSKPCIFMFNGAAYSGLGINDLVFDENNNASDQGFDILNYLQHHLRIVDPLYGWLRPKDLIYPYRLEMVTKNVFFEDNNNSTTTTKLKLNDFWKPAIQSCIQNSEQNDNNDGNYYRPIVIVNIASDEYSAAVDHGNLIIKIVFRHGGRVIAVHAKRARGLMVRYMALNKIENLEQILGFNLEGYTFQSKESTYSQEEYSRLLELESKSKSNDDSYVTTKGGKKKKMEHMTLVFDRPGDWKK